MNRIGFIGGGKMAAAIIKGIINSNWCDSKNIIVSDKNEDALKLLGETYEIKTTLSNIDVIKNANIILFAVKPFVLKDVLNEIKPYITPKHIILSIAAGVAINTIEEIVGNIPVIRIMPNTPALVNEGMSAICKGNYATDEQSELAIEIFKSVGKVVKAEEKDIDIITATFGKAVGSFGAFCVSTADIIDYLINKARSFIFSTSIPPINIAWTNWLLTEKIEYLKSQKDILENVTQKAHKLINLNGFETVSESQIIPIIIGNNEKTLNVSENLKSQGYYIPAIRPPTVPEGTSRLRISLTADSRIEDFEKILKIVKS